MNDERPMKRASFPALAVPVIAAAAVRLGFLALVLLRSGTGALYRADTLSYLLPGRNVLFHGSYSAAGLPELVRTPGYSLFLAAVILAGPIAVALAQIVLSLLSVLVVGRIAFAVFGNRRAALAGAWLFAFEPLSVIYSIQLLSETLFLALFLLFADRMTAFLLDQRLRTLATAGLLLAAATFVRPVTYYLPLALAVGLFIVLRHAPGLRWRAPAVLLLCVLPWLAAWQIRNKMETGYGGFSSIQPQDLYFFHTAEVTGRLQGRPMEDVLNELGYNDERLFLARHPAAAHWNQAQRLEFMRSEASRILWAHPGLFLRAYCAGMLRVAFNPGSSVLFSLLNLPVDEATYHRERFQGPLAAALWTIRRHPGQTAVMAAMLLLLLTLYALALRGLARSAHWKPTSNASLFLLLGLALYFFAVSGGAIGAARFRLPIMPILCIFAAAGIVRRKPPESHLTASDDVG